MFQWFTTHLDGSVIDYLEEYIEQITMEEFKEKDQEEIEACCKKYWGNSSVRRYFINRCIKKKKYDAALDALNESIIYDKDAPGLISGYSKKKKEIYLLQRNREVYVEQLWKLPKYAHVERVYKEEKLYDRLLAYVMEGQGVSALQEYGNVLKKDYPDQILEKYKREVRQMAVYSGDRKRYQQLVTLLRTMQKIKGGTKVVVGGRRSCIFCNFL